MTIIISGPHSLQGDPLLANAFFDDVIQFVEPIEFLSEKYYKNSELPSLWLYHNPWDIYFYTDAAVNESDILEKLDKWRILSILFLDKYAEYTVPPIISSISQLNFQAVARLCPDHLKPEFFEQSGSGGSLSELVFSAVMAIIDQRYLETAKILELYQGRNKSYVTGATGNLRRAKMEDVISQVLKHVRENDEWVVQRRDRRKLNQMAPVGSRMDPRDGVGANFDLRYTERIFLERLAIQCDLETTTAKLEFLDQLNKDLALKLSRSEERLFLETQSRAYLFGTSQHLLNLAAERLISNIQNNHR